MTKRLNLNVGIVFRCTLFNSRALSHPEEKSKNKSDPPQPVEGVRFADDGEAHGGFLGRVLIPSLVALLEQRREVLNASVKNISVSSTLVHIHCILNNL